MRVRAGDVGVRDVDVRGFLPGNGGAGNGGAEAVGAGSGGAKTVGTGSGGAENAGAGTGSAGNGNTGSTPARTDIGAVIRGARAAARLTQAELGARCGYSGSTVSRIEANRLVPPRDTLVRIAEVLRLPPERLGLATAPSPTRPIPGEFGTQPAPAPTMVTARQVRGDPEGESVRRRQLLAGAVGVGAAAVTGSPAAAQPRQPQLTDPAAPLEAVLFQPRPAEPVPLHRLAAAVTAAHRDFRAARYAALGTELPALIATAEATRDHLTGHARERAQTLLARVYVLATELAVKARSEVAWATADRALTAARAAGDPVPLGEAARVLAITMRHAGRSHTAVDLLTRTATSLDTAPQALAVRTSLLLTAAYSAAQCGDRTTALDLADEADESATRLTTATPELFTVQATPEQCALYRIGVHNALGTPDEAVPHARRLATATFPTAERRARYWTDTARMWHHLGDDRRTYAALRAVERQAPEEARRPSLRALTADLLYAPTRLPGLKEFAARTGALPGG
jgi:transcriptional regulator with XRE-family HTH domain